MTGDEPASLVAAIHQLLAERHAMLAVAESLTGGLVAAALTDRPGASAVFAGSLTAYSTAAKATLLGVDPALLAARGTVDPEVAAAMAVGVTERFAVEYGLATTGVAGPDPQDGRPVGMVFIAAAWPGGTRVVELALPGDRTTIRQRTVVEALVVLRSILEETTQG